VVLGAILWAPLCVGAMFFVGYLGLTALVGAPAIGALLTVVDSPRLRAWPAFIIFAAVWASTLGILCLGISDSTLG
jgi:hypothetical protein